LYGSTAGYQDLFNKITTDLLALPAVQNATDPLIAAIAETTAAIHDVVFGVGKVNTSVGGVNSSVSAQTGPIVDTEANTSSSAQLAAVMVTLLQSIDNLSRAIRGFGETQVGVLVNLQTLTAQGVIFSQTQIDVLQNLKALIAQVALINEAQYQELAGQFSLNKTLNNVAFNLQFANLKEYNGFIPFKRGGWVDGAGTGESDSISARLSRGEFVVNAGAARRYAGTLEAINTGRPVTANDNGPELRAVRAELTGLRSENKQLLTALKNAFVETGAKQARAVRHAAARAMA